MDQNRRVLKNECVPSGIDNQRTSVAPNSEIGGDIPSNHESSEMANVNEANDRVLLCGEAPNQARADTDVPKEDLQQTSRGELRDTESPFHASNPGAALGSNVQIGVDGLQEESCIDSRELSEDRIKEMLQKGSSTKEEQLGNDPHVLDPDSSLMVKFQRALSELLTKQLAKLTDEVVELSYSLRKKAKEREDLGVNLFNLQEEVAHSHRQQALLNKSLLELEDSRCNLEKELEKVRGTHKEEYNRTVELKNQEEKLRLEIETLKNYECQLKKYETERNSELAVSQRIADKTEKQKEERALEKQKQDILLLRLRQAVLGLESKRDQLQAQREIKMQQQESLCKTIAEASADLEALQKEQVRLTRVWNGVVISLQQRDRVYNDVQRDLRKAKESFQLMLSEIDSYRKMAKEEMQHNEKSMNILNRLELEYDDLAKLHEKNKELVSDMETEYAHTTGLIKQTEENLRAAVTDGKVLSQQSTYQQRELERLTLQKLSLEMEILDRLQDQSKHDKAFQHFTRTIRSLKDDNRNQEMLFITMENQIARTMVEVEQVRGTAVFNEKLLSDANNEFDKYTNNFTQLEGTVKRSTTIMENKMLVIDQLSKKLDSILARSGITEESPQEIRIKAIEMEIEESTQDSEKKQAFWLRLQSHIVHLTEERQKQLQDLNLLYKQIHILNQRALKIEQETVKHEEGKKNIDRQMHALNVSLNKITLGLFNERGHKENLDRDNMIAQTEALSLLKELERTNIEQEEDLITLEENTMLLNQDIQDIKRECLAWEKKVQLATETKQMNEDDKKANGELREMRAAMHRMDLRYSQLRKFQENLVRDLEQCIMRREALLDQADAKEKRSSGHLSSVSNRIVFERKLENLTNRTKQANAEAKSIFHQLESDFPKEAIALNESLDEAKAALYNVQDELSKVKKKLEEAQLLKLQKLELIVRLQKKVKFYSKVKEGKHKLLFRTESAMEAEMYRQQSMNNDMINLIGVLQQHFPSLHLQFLRLNNTLQRQSI